MAGDRRKPPIAMRLGLIVLLTSLVAAPARAQRPATSAARSDSFLGGSCIINYECVALQDADDVAGTEDTPARVRAGFAFLRSISKGIMVEFAKAWSISGEGTTGRECVLLIFRTEDGSYAAKSQGYTNEYQRFTFRWQPAALAIVHTHPNGSDPRPGDDDKRVADRFGVPNFTISLSGMYVYDPATKKTTKVLNGLDWLNLSRWTREIGRNVDISSSQVPESGYNPNPGAAGRQADSAVASAHRDR